MKKHITLLCFLLSVINIFSQENIIDFNKINFVDSNGKKQGLWIEYSVSSINMYNPRVDIYQPKINVYSIGTFVDNIKVDKWYYFENQRLYREDWYKNDSLCYTVNYYLNNQIQSQGWYNLKFIDGIYRETILPEENGTQIIPVYGSKKINNWTYYCLDGSVTKEEDEDEKEYEKYNFCINNMKSYDLRNLNIRK